MALLSLPAELLDLVLCELDVRALLVCIRVCTALARCIRGNVKFQYRLELYAAGMQDNPASTLCTTEKLWRLRELQGSWRIPGTLTETSIIPMSDSNGIFGSNIVQKTAAGDLHLTCVHSRLRPVIEREKIVNGPGSLSFPEHNYDVDFTQDLLVVVEKKVVDGTEFTGPIHFLSLSTQKPHPLASKAVLHIDSTKFGSAWTLVCQSMQVMGELILWSFIQPEVSMDICYRLLNWHTGRMLWDVCTHDADFSPMSMQYFQNQYFGCACLQRGRPSIRMYRVDAGHIITDFNQADGALVCVLELPELAPGYSLIDLWFASSNGDTDACIEQAAPFNLDGDTELCALTMQIESQRPLGPSPDFDLFIPASTLLSCVDKSQQNPDRKIWRWHEWGPTNTRMIMSPRGLDSACSSVNGSKSISEVSASPSSVEYHVYDFNPRRVRQELWQFTQYLRSAEKAVSSVTMAPMVLRCACFTDTITTSLPYTVTRIKVPQAPRGTEHTEALLLKDGLVLIDEIGDTKTQYRFQLF